jgi:23S rRNA (cytidine1920-2'-O)/16S rRNA (cytidine1409-2'-O)-methyltransferase
MTINRKVGKERLDKLLVQQGLAETRTRAQALILAGQVFGNGQRLDKAGQVVSPEVALTVREPLPFVSRGGLKLAAALAAFQLDPSGKRCLDIGASTGGFTDCLLQRGACHVTALDVGHGQLDWRLRQDPRVEVRENINARYLQAADFPTPFDLVVIDVSFISLKRILPILPPLLHATSTVIPLIKPQFEVGRHEVGRGGIVRDPVAQARVVEEIREAAASLLFHCQGIIDSPVLGADGNREFLGLFRLTSDSPARRVEPTDSAGER